MNDRQWDIERKYFYPSNKIYLPPNRTTTEKILNKKQVPTYHVSNQDLAVTHRFEAWREEIYPFVRLEPHEDGSSNGVYSMTSWAADDMVLAEEKLPGARFFYSMREIMHCDAENYYLFLLTSGRNSTVLGDKQLIDARPGSLCLHSVLQPCEGVVSEASAISVFLPRRLLGECTERLPHLTSGVLDTPVADLLRDYLLLVRQSFPLMNVESANGVAKSISQLVLAASLGTPDSLHEASEALELAKKARIKRFIESRLSDRNLSAQLIIDTFGISRSCLYRAFQNEGGIKAYIMSLRLNACLKIVKKSEQPPSIKQLSHHLGFLDGADLGRAFRRHYGISLQEFRRALAENRPIRRPGAWSDWHAALRHLG